MIRKIINWTVGILLAFAALTAAYLAGRYSRPAVAVDNQSAELEELRSRQADAAIVRRVSQQMEDIAYQQKAVSDQERDHARQQSELALEMRDRAEQESRLARQAERRAKAAAEEAQQQRETAMALQKVAEEQRDQANYAKSVTDTLSYRTVGRTLGSSSYTQFEGGNYELAAKLAYNSWYMLENYGGNTYYAETFTALSQCSETTRSITTRKGGAVRAVFPIFGDGCVAVTDYGEIEIVRRGQGRQVVLQNEGYDFRDVLVGADGIYALSFNGPLCLVQTDGSVREIQLPKGEYMKLADCGNGQFLIASKRNLLSYNTTSGKVRSVMAFDRDLLSMAYCSKVAFLFFADGIAEKYAVDGTVAMWKANDGRRITAATYDRKLDVLLAGCDNGDVLVVDSNDKVIATFYGHNSRVTGMLIVNDIMITSSYDKNVFLWNLPFFRYSATQSLADVLGISSKQRNGTGHSVSQEWLNPVPLKLDSWPLSICQFGEYEIAVGTSAGNIIRYNVSSSDMARQIREKYNVALDMEEWDHYVGSTFQYISLE